MIQYILLQLLLSFIIDTFPLLPFIIIILILSLIIYDILFDKESQPKKTEVKSNLYKMDIDFINHPRPRM